ncbi:14296_t:CDS:1, partial [Funneliformis geosporum]
VSQAMNQELRFPFYLEHNRQKMTPPYVLSSLDICEFLAELFFN